HRRVRSQRAAADRRLHQPVRRHQLDGDVLAEPDAHRARARAAQPRLRGHRDQVLRAFPAHRRSDDQHRRRHGLWSDEDGFFYDVLNLPDGGMYPLKVRSMVGLIPLFAVETLEPELCAKVPAFTERLDWFLNYRPDLAGLVSRWHEPGKGDRRLLSLLRGSRMKKLLRRMLDESEFLSDFGVRALSRYHREHPYTLEWNNQRFSVEYQPGESTSGLFGGNSNWRGPIWMPVNYLIIESLQKFHHYY